MKGRFCMYYYPFVLPVTVTGMMVVLLLSFLNKNPTHPLKYCALVNSNFIFFKENMPLLRFLFPPTLHHSIEHRYFYETSTGLPLQPPRLE